MNALGWLRWVFLLHFCVSLAAWANDDLGWPREISSDGSQVTIYQPQVESWKDNQLEERAAISVQPTGSAEPTFGVAWFHARTEVDKTTRMVSLEEIKVTRVNFPSAPAQETTYLNLLQTQAPSVLRPVALDRLQASLTITRAESKEEHPKLKNEPPKIIYSSNPAILVLIDGKPALRPTGLPKGSPYLLAVINTRALLVFDQAHGKYYFYLGNRWMVASTEKGPWSDAGNLAPPLATSLDQIKQGAVAKKQVDLLEAEAGQSPKIFVSTEPAELIQTEGSPQWEPVADTKILYVKNSPDDVFLNTQDQNYYVTLSGRWYSSKSLEGPWSYVSPRSLPGDFAKIPENHPKGAVLASVAGTPQAQEAMISNEIPQTATIDRQKAGVAIQYDGAPEFRPIEGTPLKYAANSPIPVIEVDEHSFYSVQDGVWFEATRAEGPWVVATKVPQVIYSIPPSSSLYYVTYVYVYGSTPREVYVGYLPGYMGSYVDDGVVVFGTGYVYPAWIGGVWFGPPVTFGFGVGWGFGFGWGLYAGFGAPFFHPWWGPWRGGWPHGFPVTNTNVYRNWDRAVARSTWERNEIGHGTFAPNRIHAENNVYADRNGNVYRHGNQGWEKLGQNPQTHAANVPHEVEQERAARQRGEQRMNDFRNQVSRAPSVGRRRIRLGGRG